MGKHKLAFVGLALLALIVVGVTVVIPEMRRSAREMEHDLLVARPLATVRNGASRVSIMNAELLHALAADQKCIDNLTEIIFSSMALNDRDQIALKRLQNVSTIGFYCCKNVDALVPTIRSMALNLLWFEIADISPEALDSIRDANSIKEIGFQQNLTEAQVRILQSHPARIKITTSFPLDAYD